MPPGAVGKALHVAARLQALAPPNSVVIAETTNRLVPGRFDQDDLGPQTLKGIADPVHAFRVYRVREGSSRFEANRARIITPLVGRQVELAFLQQRWRDASDGEGQAVFVSGVSGIGKSRIVYELEARIEREQHFNLTFQCLPHCTQSALFPVIQQIRRLGDLRREDSHEALLNKVERLLSLATKQVEKAMPFVAEMMSIPIGSRYGTPPLAAPQMKAQILFVLVEVLLNLSAKRPILCLLEDAQWIDPSTQELLDLVVGRIEKARILLVVTHRPEHQVPSRGNVSGLTLTRLKRRDTAEMVRLTLGDHKVSTAVMNRIIDETDAIPLFVEELARGIIESGRVGAVDANDPDFHLPASWSVPESLRDSLAARLDRAPMARNVAQTAAVIGREFSYDMLLQVTSPSLSNDELDSTLAHLKRHDIVRLIDNKPNVRYEFKHALVRDAAYESFLISSRREVHSRIASIIRNGYPEIVAGQPELLAFHYSLAGNVGCAVRYWLLGGHRARSRSANVEAAGQYQKALEFLVSVPDTPERRAIELEIQLSLGLSFIAVRGYSSDDTREAFERACSLSAELGDPRKELQAIFGLWGHCWMRAYHDRAIELAEKLLAKADQLRDLMALILGYRSLGSTLFTLGDFIRARDYLDRAVALGQQSATGDSSLSYAVDPRIAAQLMLGWDLWILGYPDQGLRNVLHALSEATGQNDAYTAALAHYVTSTVQLLRGDIQDALVNADQSLALAKEHRINLFALYSQFGRGCALAKLGQKEQAIFEIREGIKEARRSNLGYMRGVMLGWLATVQAEIGDSETALSTVDEALRQTNDISGRAWEAELRRLRGDILLATRPDTEVEAEFSYSDAIMVARTQSARSLELRATTSLARFLRARGRHDEARAHLIPIFSWFTEGLDTADLKEAKQLHDELN
jgi:tetratricopeptide (TPR) repeat protein